jgi:putative hydrolases of HD superfamily
MNQLAQITDFITSIEVLKTTVRHNRFHNGRQESVAEHTWRMVLFFITVQESLQLEVDVLKVIKMIIIHDVPEWLDGDIPSLPEYQDQYDNKQDRELYAAHYYFDRLPSPLNQEFYNLYVEFEDKKTYESKVAKVIDRMEWLFQHVTTPINTRSESEKWDFAFQYSAWVVQDLNHPQITKMRQDLIMKLKDIFDENWFIYDKEYVNQLLVL